jgi:hypothetical protein
MWNQAWSKHKPRQQPDTPPLGQPRWVFPNELLSITSALADLETDIATFKQAWQPQPGTLVPEVQR